MRELKERTIVGRGNPAANFHDLSITDCVFDGCYLPGQSNPGQWTSIRNVHLSNVTNINCSIDTAKIEDCSLHNLTRRGDMPLFMWGCVYSRVTLSGKISAIKINRSVGINGSARTTQLAWDKAIKDFYGSIDWAVDISGAKFAGGVSFEAIPGDKIRRDPETQILVTRETLSRCDWRQLDYGRSAFDIELSWFLDTSLFDSVVLAARMGSKSAKGDVAVLRMLREHGIAS